MDMEDLMILLQKRYNVLREIARITDELSEAVTREDHVSASLLLDMRGDELERYEACRENIMLLAETGPEEARIVRELVLSDSLPAHLPGGFEEQKIYELRHKTDELAGIIREKDRNLNRRVSGDRSFYTKTTK